MIRARSPGPRVFAGFVMAGALLHLAGIGAEAWTIFTSGDVGPAATTFLLVGIVPALGAILLAREGWTRESASSSAFSMAGLAILLVAFVLSHRGPVRI